MEESLTKNITELLLEMGTGFAFIGRQKEILVGGRSRKIDLLFYHIRLRCYVVCELKAKPFEPEFAGKLNYYVNAVDELIRKEDLFNKFLSLVENTSQKQSVSYFAEKLHVAPHYLSRVVSEVSGSSVMEWVSRNIVLQAKVQLKNSDKSVLSISEELGFATLPFFCRFFKKSTGFTPTEYRQSNDDA